MSAKSERRVRRESGERASRAGLPAIGLEAEFTTVVDGTPQQPEDVFGSPRKVIRGPLVHRTGRSYHLPTGAAVYFDSGVLELATPMIEIAPACGARATRSLWEGIAFLRHELDAWELRTGRSVKLAGFSTHYNVSFDVPLAEQRAGKTVERLAYLLTHVLAAPVMLLASNRQSTGVGVRPRGNRIEITADFTPDPELMAATATLIVGIVRDVMTWSSYSLDQLDRRAIPVVREFVPIPHSSRKGWVAKYTCFPANPFTTNVDDVCWTVQGGEQLSLREMAARTIAHFWPSVQQLGDRPSLIKIRDVLDARATSLLDLDDRPAEYEDVGRLCSWRSNSSTRALSRSRFERVLGHAIAGRRLRIEGTWHRPVAMRGWTHVVFRRETDGVRHSRSLDDLLGYLDAWDGVSERRSADRAVSVARERDASTKKTMNAAAPPSPQIVAEDCDQPR